MRGSSDSDVSDARRRARTSLCTDVRAQGMDEGRNEWLILDAADEIRSWGHMEGCELILKSDNEAVMISVREALGRYLGGSITPENIRVGESQSNGAVENACKTIKELKVYKCQLEERIGSIEDDSFVMLWMARWSAMAYNRYQQGDDGRTPFQRQTGRMCRSDVVPFGEKVLYRESKKSGEKKRIMEIKWREGIWLGHARASTEVLIGTTEGVVRAFTFKRLIESQRWDGELVKNMKGAPKHPDPNIPGLHAPMRVHVRAEGPFAEIEQMQTSRAVETHRSVYLKKGDFEKFGYTPGCEGCRRMRYGVLGYKNHTVECRRRIETCLNEEKHPRYERALDRRLAAQDLAIIAKAEISASSGLTSSERKRGRSATLEPSDVAEGGPVSSSGAVITVGASGGQAVAMATGSASDGANAVSSPPMAGDAGRSAEKRQASKTDVQDSKRSRVEDAAQAVVPKEVVQRRLAPDARRGHAEDDAMVLGSLVEALKQVDICELYSPPRVTKEGAAFRLSTGEAMDLTTGWVFSLLKDRRQVLQYIDEKQPPLVVGSPMCTLFSSLQNLSPWTVEKARRLVQARVHLDFCMRVYERQARSGRLFLHEHPMNATSWQLPRAQEVASLNGGQISIADQCMYGSLTKRPKWTHVAPSEKGDQIYD